MLQPPSAHWLSVSIPKYAAKAPGRWNEIIDAPPPEACTSKLPCDGTAVPMPAVLVPIATRRPLTVAAPLTVRLPLSVAVAIVVVPVRLALLSVGLLSTRPEDGMLTVPANVAAPLTASPA